MVSKQAEFFFSFCDKYPDIFPVKEMSTYWDRCVDIEDLGLLKAALLKVAKKKCGDCFDCDLSKNRMSGRPVFSDASYYSDPFFGYENRDLVGAYTAKIVIVAESPGQYEQRTGIPFVSPLVLTGSPCARKCSNFEECYPYRSRTPRAPCKPRSLAKDMGDDLVKLDQTMKDRAALYWEIQTAGSLLDKALMEVGLWREGWNDRQSIRGDESDKGHPRPGSVYLCNIVKCRSCEVDEDHAGGVKDTPPTKEQADACRKWLNIQLEIIEPKVIIALGAPAISGLLGIAEPRVLDLCGTVYTGPYLTPVICGIHPAYIMYQKDPTLKETTMRRIVSVFQKAVDVANQEDIEPEWKPLTIVEVSEHLQEERGDPTVGETLKPIDIPIAPAPSTASYLSETIPGGIS